MRQETDINERLIDAVEIGSQQEIHTLMQDLHAADIANLLESIPPEQRRIVWSAINSDLMGEVLTEVSDGVREGLVEDMDHDSLVTAVGSLDIDDIADLIPDLPDDVIADVLFAVDKAARESLHAVLSYPEDTAGGLMNVDTVTVRENIPLAVVLRYLRLRGELPEYTDKLFVVGRDGGLKGILFLSTLLTSDASERVGKLMDNDPIVLNVMQVDEEVAAAFERYNLISAPVVDDDQRLLGRITIDDVVDVIRQEADHTVMVRAGLSEEEDIFAPVVRSARSRALWLGVNLITAVVASWVIGRFEHTIEKLVALAVLMPIIASMGGNAGTQTLTVIIRGLGLGTITYGNAWRVLRKELLVGGMNGIIWAIAVAVIATIWYRDIALGLIIAVAMIINLCVAALAGVALPFLFQRMRIDPALASGVALTTVTDVIGFLSVLGLAALFLV
ncbi:MAG: magnesium transporter [Gammaproteobacteria bacterium]|nr:magnesium transporter [Gammaproteobacteria bacterium]